MNSQRENSKSKGDFVLKTPFEAVVLKISEIQKINLSQKNILLEKGNKFIRISKIMAFITCYNLN